MRFPALGFDPAPGDPDELARLARDTARAAAEVHDLSQVVERLGSLSADWSGEAADSFAEQVGDLPAQLRSAHESFGEVARQVDGWSRSLHELQSEGRAAERAAAEALTQLRAARAHAASFGLPPTSGGASAFPDHLAAASAAGRAVTAAQAELAAARARGERVQERAREQVRRVELAVREAARIAPPGPGPLERVWGSFVETVKRYNQQAEAFVQEHKEVIAAIVDIVSGVAFAAGFVAGLAAWPLLVAGAVVLGGTALLAAYTDEKDMGDVALATAGLALGGGAHLAGKAATTARAASLGGPVSKLPGMFTPGLVMGQRELVWRTVQLQPTLAGHAVGLVDNVSMARKRGYLPPAGTPLVGRRSDPPHTRSVESGRAAGPVRLGTRGGR